MAMLCSDHKREQDRARQDRQRRRDRADRLDLQAAAEAAKLPLAWRPDFLEFVRVARDKTDKARTQVEQSALLLPEGPARQAYLKRNHPNTKVSIVRLSREFVRRKKSLAWVDLYQDAEYADDGDDRLYIEVDWTNLQEVAAVLGDPSDMELVVLQPMMGFVLSIQLAAVGAGHTLVGFAQAIELLRFLDEMHVRQLDARAA